MEIYDKRDQGFIAVWLTNTEQESVDRPALAKQLLTEAGNPKKCRVVFFLSGRENLFDQTEGLLLRNLRN